MVNKLKRLYFGLFPHRMKSADYVERLREKGLDVGEGTYFFGPSKTEVDTQRPWMLHIGSYCKITSGVVILAHDYSRSVLRRVYGEIIGEAKKTWIGDNVFIGMNSVVLMGSHIGNNVIIGAGSVVSGSIPDNCVAAGVPARVICSLEDYYNKRKAKSPKEGLEYAREFIEFSGRQPTEAEMGPFWWDFMPRDVDQLRDKGIFTHLSGDNEMEILHEFQETEPLYANFQVFLDEVKSEGTKDKV